MRLDRLLTSSAPVNSTAARVIRKGYAYEAKVKPGCTETWDAPPPSKRRPSAAPDITGFRRGFMTALRYHESGKGGAKWLVRCDCGNFEVRTAAKWTAKQQEPDACTVCRKVHFIKSGHSLGWDPRRAAA